MILKRITYAVGVLALLAGLWGLYTRLFVGERDVNYGSYVVWGLWVAMYLFLAGIAAGSYMVATLDYLFNVKPFKGTGKVMLWGAFVALPAALASIGMDLGHMERIWKVYAEPNFSSMLTQMVWGYSLFFMIVIISLILAFRKVEGWLMKTIMVIGLVLSVFVSGGVGALLGVNASRIYWHVGLLPAQFPFFSLASGAALMLIIVGWFNAKNKERSDLLWILALITIALSVVKVYFLVTDFAQSLYAGVPDNVQAVRAVMFGEYWWAFWIIQIGLGSILPLTLLSFRKLARNGLLAGFMGLLVLVGFAVARANVVFPALTIPEIQGLATAFTGPHLDFAYFPSMLEWSVTAGIVGAAILVFLLGFDFLGLLKTNMEVKK